MGITDMKALLLFLYFPLWWYAYPKPGPLR